ncbi:MAG TPA: TIM barrel protein [Candidatus Nanoarchaeia archaeon]|nr:TIM barrel protein [Candidatus Nanoarchaeia archaeon]
MQRLLFGTAGIPHSTEQRNTVNGITQVKNLGLDAMELEFVHSVFVKKEQSSAIKSHAEKEGIVLSSHSPYYLNLNAQDAKKLSMSVHLLANSAIITGLCGGVSIAFHPAFYMKQDAKRVYATVKEQLKKVVNKVKEAGVKIWIRPELTGKPTQFGDLHEIIQLSQEIDMVMPCIDYAHYHARVGGKGRNSYDAFRELLVQLEKGLGKAILNDMHIQIAGVNYTEKGERSHTNLQESDLKWREIVKTWKEFNIKGIVIAETPNIEGDALLLKKEFEKA